MVTLRQTGADKSRNLSSGGKKTLRGRGGTGWSRRKRVLEFRLKGEIRSRLDAAVEGTGR